MRIKVHGFVMSCRSASTSGPLLRCEVCNKDFYIINCGNNQKAAESLNSLLVDGYLDLSEYNGWPSVQVFRHKQKKKPVFMSKKDKPKKKGKKK